MFPFPFVSRFLKHFCDFFQWPISFFSDIFFSLHIFVDFCRFFFFFFFFCIWFLVSCYCGQKRYLVWCAWYDFSLLKFIATYFVAYLWSILDTNRSSFFCTWKEWIFCCFWIECSLSNYRLNSIWYNVLLFKVNVSLLICVGLM